MKNNCPNDRGSISLLVLLMLLFVASISTGGLVIAASVLRLEQRHVVSAEQKIEFRAAAQSIQYALEADVDKEWNDKDDLVWEKVAEYSGLNAELTELSSSLNPHFVFRQLLERSGLGSLLFENGNPDQLQQRRVDEPLGMDLVAFYGDMISETTISEYLTGYSYININTTDEFMLEKIVAGRTDSSYASIFRNRVQNFRQQQRVLDSEELLLFLEPYEKELQGIMTIEPQWNIHFVHETLIRELVEYSPYELLQSSDKASRLIRRRESGGVKKEEIAEILGVEFDHMVLQYFGSLSWFYRLTMFSDSFEYEVIFARRLVPQDERHWSIVGEVFKERESNG